MNDSGTVLIGMLFIGIIVISLTVRLRDKKGDTARRIQRGESIHEHLRQLSRSEASEATLQELGALLQQQPVGYVPPLDQWFKDAAPVLGRMIRHPATAPFVEWYFVCFSFQDGRAQDLLLWLDTLLHDRNAPPDVVLRVVERTLKDAGSADIHWLYGRTLDALRGRSAEPAFKTLALSIGRLSYAARRPDRRLTIYDEQALANDMTASIA